MRDSIKTFIAVLIIIFIVIGFIAHRKGNIPLKYTLLFLILCLTYIFFFLGEVDKTAGLIIFFLSILLNWHGVVYTAFKGFRRIHFGIFLYASLNLILLNTQSWFKNVFEGTKYVGYFCFVVQLIFAIFLIGVNQDFLENWALFFFIHAVFFLIFLAKTDTKGDKQKQNRKKEDEDGNVIGRIYEVLEKVQSNFYAGHAPSFYKKGIEDELYEAHLSFRQNIEIYQEKSNTGLIIDFKVERSAVIQLRKKDTELEEMKREVRQIIKLEEGVKKGILVDTDTHPFGKFTIEE